MIFNNIKSKITIYSPINGNVNEINITTGEYVKPDDNLFETVNNDKFHIVLQVFEWDIQKISIGQKVTYQCNIPESKHIEHKAKIINISNYIDENTKTFKVHAKPDKSLMGMRHGIFVNAQIHIKSDTLPVIPEEAVVINGQNKIVFIVQSDTIFTKFVVKTGINENGYIEIINGDNIDKKIVLSGANYIIAEMNKK